MALGNVRLGGALKKSFKNPDSPTLSALVLTSFAKREIKAHGKAGIQRIGRQNPLNAMKSHSRGAAEDETIAMLQGHALRGFLALEAAQQKEGREAE